MSRKLLIFSSLICLLALLLMLNESGFSSYFQTSSSGAITSSASNAIDPEKARQPSKRPLKVSPKTIKPSTHSVEDLKYFSLPEITFKDTTLSAALKQLEALYFEVCYNTGESPVRFKTTIEGEPLRIVYYQSKYISPTDVIRSLAALSGMQVEIEGHQLLFTEIPTDAGMVQRKMIVPPDFEDQLKEMYPLDVDEESDINTLIYSMIGIEVSDSIQIKYNAGSSRMSIEANSRHANMVKAFLKELTINRPTQYKIQTKVVSVPENQVDALKFIHSRTNNDGNIILSDDEDQTIFRALAHIEGIDVSTSPSALFRPGEISKVEIISWFKSETENWTGYKLISTGNPYGFQNQFKVQIQLNEFEGAVKGEGIDGFGPYSSINHRNFLNPEDMPKIIRNELNAEIQAPQGATSVQIFQKPDGTYVANFIRVNLIDATGRKLPIPNSY